MKKREHDRKWRAIQNEFRGGEQAAVTLYLSEYISAFDFQAINRKLARKRDKALAQLAKEG